MKKQAEGKRIFDVPHHGFIMRKCKGNSSLHAARHSELQYLAKQAKQPVICNSAIRCSIWMLTTSAGLFYPVRFEKQQLLHDLQQKPLHFMPWSSEFVHWCSYLLL